MTAKFVPCSVAGELADDVAKAFEAAGSVLGRPISRDALEAARQVAKTLPARVDVWERMSSGDLLGEAANVREAHEALRLAVLRVPPAGMPHEPHVLAWHEWELVELPKIIQEWSDLLRAIPNGSYQRLGALVESLPRLQIEREARSSNAKKGSAVSKAANPAVRAMEEIRKTWSVLQVPGAPYPGDAAFAKAVHTRYAHVISNEGSIKNAISRWRREAREVGND